MLMSHLKNANEKQIQFLENIGKPNSLIFNLVNLMNKFFSFK